MACIAAFFTSCGSGSEKAAAPASAPLTVDVVSLQGADILKEVNIPGTIVASEEIQLFSEVNGRIQKILFEEGGRVQKGQVLVQMDSEILKAQRKLKQVELDLAVKDEQRKKKLVDAKGITQEDYEKSQSTLETVRAEIDLIDVQISKSSIVAPFSGRMGLRRVSEGAYLSSATLISTIVQDNPIKVEFSVSEKYAGEVKSGQKIKFNLDGSDKEYEASVFAFESGIDAETRMLTVRASGINDGKLMPGAYVNIKYELGVEVQAFMVPSISVIPILKGQKLLVARDGKVTEVPVQIGLRTSSQVQVFGELKAGDQVLVSGLLSVKPGMPVNTKIIEQ
ncbi:MAG: hypothetical protein RL204_454 [Bacteroidota bacterium]|jgi:membrane fusion protein (multidrug efflux system)